MKHILIGVLFLTATGCASMMRTFNDDPVRATVISGANEQPAIATISLDATRRNVVVGLTESSFGKFCAEPPPDTASNIESVVNALAKAEGGPDSNIAKGEVGIDDTYKNTAVTLAKRTELLDIYRTGTYSLCQLHINGAITNEGAAQLFMNLTDSVLSKVGQSGSE